MSLPKCIKRSIFFTIIVLNLMENNFSDAFVVSTSSTHSSSSQYSASEGTVTTTTTTTTSSTFTFRFLEGALDDPIPDVATDMTSLQRMAFSKAIPVMTRPPLLDGTMVGDAGFDPLKIAKSKEDLTRYREAEVKHGRLAMLAAVGWPISELFDDSIAKTFDLPAMLDEFGRAPSFLNNFGDVNLAYWVGVMGFAAFVDYYGVYYKSTVGQRRRAEDPELFIPGNLGFDPLGLYPKDVIERRILQLAEIKHGRVAMMAVLIYALQESITGTGLFA